MSHPIPEGYTTITPSLMFKDCAKAIEIYRDAFGAKEISRSTMPGTNKIMHAVLEIGNAKIFVSDEFGGMRASSGASFYLYVPNADSAMTQATKAGLKETMKAEDMFWGDRLGAVQDEFGINWTLATHMKDVSEADIAKGAKEMAERMKGKEGWPASNAA